MGGVVGEGLDGLEDLLGFAPPPDGGRREPGADWQIKNGSMREMPALARAGAVRLVFGPAVQARPIC